MKTKLIIATALASSLLVGCGGNEIDMVKESTIDNFSKSIAVGDALDSYAACAPKTQKWTMFETEQKEKIVQFTCRDTEVEKLAKFVGQNYKYIQDSESEKYLFNGLKKVDFVALFSISKDGKSFSVGDVGRIMYWDDGTVGSVSLPPKNLKMVYQNDILDPTNLAEYELHILAMAMRKDLSMAYDAK